MIALDSSALIAIAKGEAEADVFAEAIGARTAVIGAPTLLETRLVLQSLMLDGADSFMDDLIENPAIRTVAFSIEHYRAAVDAFRRYGRGQGHPARLNLGDCMSYAVAVQGGAPLLYKGDDFRHTDIRSALP